MQDDSGLAGQPNILLSVCCACLQKFGHALVHIWEAAPAMSTASHMWSGRDRVVVNCANTPCFFFFFHSMWFHIPELLSLRESNRTCFRLIPSKSSVLTGTMTRKSLRVTKMTSFSLKFQKNTSRSTVELFLN